jgi:hypothetical protein
MRVHRRHLWLIAYQQKGSVVVAQLNLIQKCPKHKKPLYKKWLFKKGKGWVGINYIVVTDRLMDKTTDNS